MVEPGGALGGQGDGRYGEAGEVECYFWERGDEGVGDRFEGGTRIPKRRCLGLLILGCFRKGRRVLEQKDGLEE